MENFMTKKLCYESGMIYSRSGSSYDFLSVPDSVQFKQKRSTNLDYLSFFSLLPASGTNDSGSRKMCLIQPDTIKIYITA